MSVQKFRWSRVYESSEEELITLLQARQIESERITAMADTEPINKKAERTITLWCGEGSLVVRTQSTSSSMQPGDSLRLPASLDYELRAGISGYVCYVTH